MASFVDSYLPDRIAGYPFVSTPRWNTRITSVANGSEKRNQEWEHPLHRFTAPQGVRCWEDIAELHEMWMALGGAARTFPLRDPLDQASVRMEEPGLAPTVNRTDQTLGVGDGLTRVFQLQKRYTYGAQTYDRLIALPVVDSILIGMNALPPTTADPTLEGGPYAVDISRTSGLVTFTPAPADGLALTWGGLFDVEVRFESDDVYDGIVAAFRTAGFADLSFFEVRPC